MSLPVVTKDNLDTYFNKEDYIIQTAEQIMKDFALFGVELTFSGDVNKAYVEMHEQLAYQIEELSGYEQEKLKAILYQIDIGQRDVQTIREGLSENSFNNLLAHQIILRELKKVVLRKYFTEHGI